MPRTNTPPLGLTRDQLATFLQDHEQIKAFENLFAIVEDIAPDVVQQAIIAAGSAQAGTSQAIGLLLEVAQSLAVSNAATEAKAQQALDTIAKLTQQVELLALAPPAREFKRSRYGQFYDTTVQTAALANTAYAISYNTTDLSNGVRLRSPSTSEIEVDTEGVYDFQFSIQIDKTSGGTARFWVWFRLNGVDVPNSASEIHIQGNDAEIFSSANLFFNLKAMDYVQLMWAVSSNDVQLQYRAAAGVVPAIPSIILTVSNNIQGVQ